MSVTCARKVAVRCPTAAAPRFVTAGSVAEIARVLLATSVLPCSAGEAWRLRYLALRARLAQPPRIMPEALGPLPPDRQGAPGNPYERCNRWLLYSALTYGLDRLRFICLWDGGNGDGAGGTAHMVEEVGRRTGRITWLDTRELW